MFQVEHHNREEYLVEKNSEGFVFCLCIDLIGSTAAGLELTSQQLKRFNISLVEQIRPHLKKFWLADSLMKFTGDGWLVMNKEEKVKALCYLATTMADRFQKEMHEKSGIAIARIPSLRLAICSGYDVSVELLDGNKDWVGDSARRATRASGWCNSNKIVINETVREIALRDFHTKRVTEQDHTKPDKWEEDFSLFTLGKLRPDAAEDSEVPEYFVTNLKTTGKIEAAKELGLKASERLEHKASKPGIDEIERQKILQNWNRLMASIPDYSSARKILSSIQVAGLMPDIFTYNTLIKKASDYEEAKALVDTMRGEGTLPKVFTYNSLFTKDLSGILADDILKWYLAQKYHPELPIQAAIATYRKTHRIDQALRLALDYPHLQAARKLIREHETEALAYFRTISDHDHQHPNAEYALGVALMELEQDLEAEPHLKNALKLATAGPRRTVIKKWLRQIDGKQTHKQ
ncbi:Tetratricopeptide (TPR) repeat [Methanophagales archaeon]|nr:Tetratricopeptide (TPR) repeat [Methanophagales archaeon]